MGKNHIRKIIFIALLIILFSFCQYYTDLREHRLHLFYQALFFLPVALAGFWFGLRISLLVSLAITAILLPFTFIHWGGFTSGDFNNVMELVLYNGMALILGILKDREKIKEKRLREAESLAAMGKALSGLAHDLKNPLIAIGGLSRILQKRLEKDNPCQEKIEIIIQEVQRLEKMTGEMLDFSRPLELHRSAKNLRHVIDQTLAIVDPIAQGRKVSIRNQSSQNLPLLFIDDLRIKQVLINLIINAVEASPEGESVEVRSYAGSKTLFIEVMDCGDGIPVEEREKIFAPFFTTKQGGTGLGLPIAKKIVEAHEGSLEVLNNSPKGATFRVIIPIRYLPKSPSG